MGRQVVPPVHEQLKEIMAVRDLTLDDLSKVLVEYTREYLQKILNGEATLEIPELKRLESMWGLSKREVYLLNVAGGNLRPIPPKQVEHIPFDVIVEALNLQDLPKEIRQYIDERLSDIADIIVLYRTGLMVVEDFPSAQSNDSYGGTD